MMVHFVDSKNEISQDDESAVGESLGMREEHDQDKGITCSLPIV